jgi:hypothetical protein
MSDTSKGSKSPNQESDKARQAIQKDTPSNESGSQPGHEEPKPYRPDENVDNQKSKHSRKEPGHNNSMDKTPVSGAQFVKEKKAHKDNIDKESDKADPKASG